MPTHENVTIEAADGTALEAVWSRPDDGVPVRAVAVVTHPHPLMGGDMHNPTPTALARGFAVAGIAALRINFRGTGASEGTHDEGRAEQDDVLGAANAAAEAHPGVPLVVAGYSFGADVALATVFDDVAPVAVVVVAPPLRVLPAAELAAPRATCPTLALVPAHDQFCDPARARDVTADWPHTTVESIEGADHFMNGATTAVTAAAVAFIENHLVTA